MMEESTDPIHDFNINKNTSDDLTKLNDQMEYADGPNQLLKQNPEFVKAVTLAISKHNINYPNDPNSITEAINYIIKLPNLSLLEVPHQIPTKVSTIRNWGSQLATKARETTTNITERAKKLKWWGGSVKRARKAKQLTKRKHNI